MGKRNEPFSYNKGSRVMGETANIWDKLQTDAARNQHRTGGCCRNAGAWVTVLVVIAAVALGAGWLLSR